MANGSGASFGGVFHLVSLSPVTKVKDNKNCQNTTKPPLKFGAVLPIVKFLFNFK